MALMMVTCPRSSQRGLPRGGTRNGLTKGAVYRGEQIELNLADAIRGRVACDTIVHLITGEKIVSEGQLITPQVAGFHKSVELVTMVVVGGMAAIWGSGFGAALLSLLPEVLAKFQQATRRRLASMWPSWSC